MSNCPHCGLVHETTCPRIKAIEYQPDGVTVKRVEFHDTQPIEHAGGLRPWGSFTERALAPYRGKE